MGEPRYDFLITQGDLDPAIKSDLPRSGRFDGPRSRPGNPGIGMEPEYVQLFLAARQTVKNHRPDEAPLQKRSLARLPSVCHIRVIFGTYSRHTRVAAQTRVRAAGAIGRIPRCGYPACSPSGRRCRTSNPDDVRRTQCAEGILCLSSCSCSGRPACSVPDHLPRRLRPAHLYTHCTARQPPPGPRGQPPRPLQLRRLSRAGRLGGW
jgi:hypothetical protein